jgi:hypothetical protein
MRAHACRRSGCCGDIDTMDRKSSAFELILNARFVEFV